MANGTTELSNLIPDIWSPIMYDELRNSIMFANYFSRQYEGAIKAQGDTVKVNQIVAPTGEILTNDKAQFASSQMTVNQVSITANKRASASFEVTDLAQLQSLEFAAQAREALIHSIRLAMESDIVAGLVPSSSAPDHQIAPASGGLAAVDVGTLRTLLSLQKVPMAQRALFLDPQYYGDLINSNVVTSSDFVSANSAQEGVVKKFNGFDIMEHNLLSADVGFAAHPSALLLVMQQEIRLKISDLHPNNKYAYLISADMVYGWTLADNKRIVKITG